MNHPIDASQATVADVMTRNVHVLRPDDPVSEALRSLAARGFSGAVVVDDARRPVGVFSEMDALRVLANARFHGDPTGSVRDHMSRSVMQAAPTDDAFTVALRLIGDGVRRYPVVDEDGALIGLVTVTDLAEVLAGDLVAGVRRLEHPPGAAWDEARSRDRDRGAGT